MLILISLTSATQIKSNLNQGKWIIFVLLISLIYRIRIKYEINEEPNKYLFCPPDQIQEDWFSCYKYVKRVSKIN